MTTDWIDGWMDGCVDGWMDGCIQLISRKNPRTSWGLLNRPRVLAYIQEQGWNFVVFLVTLSDAAVGKQSIRTPLKCSIGLSASEPHKAVKEPGDVESPGWGERLLQVMRVKKQTNQKQTKTQRKNKQVLSIKNQMNMSHSMLLTSLATRSHRSRCYRNIGTMQRNCHYPMSDLKLLLSDLQSLEPTPSFSSSLFPKDCSSSCTDGCHLHGGLWDCGKSMCPKQIVFS